MLQITSIDISGITIMEPVTALTDLMVSAVCLFAFLKLKSHYDKQHQFQALYRFFFLAMAITTFYGGLIGHAFLHYLSFEWKVPGWITSMLAVAVLERASIMHCRPFLKKITGDFFIILNIIELITIMFLAIYNLNFIFVEIHATYGMMIILFSFEFYLYRRAKNKGSKLVMWSVFVGFLALITHLAKPSINIWFNYIDLSHVLMAISSYILYRGVEAMSIDNFIFSPTLKVKTEPKIKVSNEYFRT